MAVTKYTWQVEEEAELAIPAEVTVSPFDRGVTLNRDAYLGFGLIRPFQRDLKNDFANTGGVALVKSAIGQILGTRASSDFTIGEMPWRTEFGSIVYLLRHQPNTDVLQELARVYVADALRLWEPRVALRRVDITQKRAPNGELSVLHIEVAYNIIQRSVVGNQVVLPNVEQSFEVTV